MAMHFDTMILKIKECLERQKQLYTSNEAKEIITDFEKAIETYTEQMKNYNDKTWREHSAKRKGIK